MAVSLAQFIKQLEDSGIVPPGKLADFLPPKASPQDAEELSRDLVKQSQLTKFQAHQILNGKAKALILGSYTILDKIGAGGMGQVFKAEHRRMKRVVALKMLPPAMMKDAAAAARFQREVEAAAKLEHPNIVTAYDADQANGIHFLIMQFVDGQDLSALVKKNGPLPIPRAIDYVVQAARGLSYAHTRGVVHRDMKPANLLVGSGGVVKVLDMGLARLDLTEAEPADQGLTTAGQIMGTLDYMAPEQASDTKQADARSDIYSLGCTLYALLVGQPLFPGDTTVKKILAHNQQPPPNLQAQRPDASPALNDVFQKMVAKRPGDRYQTMDQVIAALETLNASPAVSAILPPATLPPAALPPAMPPPSMTPPAFYPPGVQATQAPTLPLAAPVVTAVPVATFATAGAIVDTFSTVSRRGRPAKTARVAGDATWGYVAKLVGGTFATIIAPILVTYLIKWLENPPQAIVQVAAPASPAPAASPSPAMSQGPAMTVAASAQPATTSPPAFPVSKPPVSSSPIVRPAPPAIASAPAPISPPTLVNRSAPAKAAQQTTNIDFVSLFDGKTLQGWSGDSARWSVSAGAIVGQMPPGNPGKSRSYLSTTSTYRNFVLTARFKSSAGDFGVLFRGKPNTLYALQVAIGPEQQGRFWDESPVETGGAMRRVIDNPDRGNLVKPDQWNDIKITAQDNHFQCEINGLRAFDVVYTKGPPSGVVSFKVKQSGATQRSPVTVAFKDITIARLPD